jgi:DEAD/DEAH box helicase
MSQPHSTYCAGSDGNADSEKLSVYSAISHLIHEHDILHIELVCYIQIWVCHVKRQVNLYVSMKVPVDARECGHINSEGRIVTQFNHFNIVKGLGWLRFPGTAPRSVDALVLEYCPVGNLWEQIEQKQTPGRENKFNNCMDDHQRCAQFPSQQGQTLDAIVAYCLSTLFRTASACTGTGKTLVYEAAALCCKKATIVVSPLVGLWQQKASKVADCGVGVIEAYDANLGQCGASSVSVIFTTPEQLLDGSKLRNHFSSEALEIKRLVVDEAHIVVQ